MLRVPPESLATADMESIPPRMQRERESKDSETGLHSTKPRAQSKDVSKREASAAQAVFSVAFRQTLGNAVLRRTLRRRQLRQPAQQLAPFRR